MTDPDLAARAEQRLLAALAGGARDPRDFYRQRLAELKTKDRAAYQRAVSYYQDELIPAVAAEDSDPLAEWLEYGRLLAELMVRGQTVQVDPTGLSQPYARPVPPDALVLHLPDRTSDAALLVGIPPRLSPAQRATHDLLVKQAQSL